MPPVISITGRSGSGKTTLIEGLIGYFAGKGLKVSIIKHLRHEFQVDHPGKDTWRYREAGAAGAGIINVNSFAVFADHEGDMTPQRMADRFFPDADLVIIEGDRESSASKIEVIGDSGEEPLFRSGVKNITALVCDHQTDSSLPTFGRNEVQDVGRYIERTLLEGRRGV